jgi:hypothetical protein
MEQSEQKTKDERIKNKEDGCHAEHIASSPLRVGTPVSLSLDAEEGRDVEMGRSEVRCGE